MKILLINTVCGVGSTGRICYELAQKLEKEGHEVKIAYGRGAISEGNKKYGVLIGGLFSDKISALHTRLTDRHGFANKRSTKNFLKWAEEFSPDMVWLHNLHGYYINVEMLFAWLKKRPEIQVKWTLHDCWAFTGHCTYFTVANCDKWKTHCENCPQKKAYPSSVICDNSRNNYIRKRTAFTGVKNMTLITPSMWLANLVKQSFLKEYQVDVVYNTIDTTVFKPTPSDFRKNYGLENKKIILGVSFKWGPKKGLNDFIKLSQMIDENYRIVLVGVSKKQKKSLPKNIIGIERTHSKKQLAEIYTAADVFANPSRQETFGLTTIEALSCGTTPIVYKGTACEEVVEHTSGIVVPCDVDELYKAIITLNS